MTARRTAAALFLIGILAASCTAEHKVSVSGRASATDNTGGTDGTTTTLDGGTDTGTIEWGPCHDDLAKDETLECATLTVPLDYANPDGETIEIALVRAPATSSREGAVLFNPGGPGGSGFDPIAVNGVYLQETLGLEHFDLIGFDPRGVDRSGGITCVDAAYMDAHSYLDDTPDTPEEQALLDNSDSSFDEACTSKYGDTLRFYSTANTARDMDTIRAGLGDDQLSFLGISYGTYLGGVYATMFPDRVRGMVLDSAYEPNGDTVEQQYLTQLVGFEKAFDDWAAWCQGDTACEFHATDVGVRWDALRLQLDEHPLTADDGREINQSTLDTATQAALYSAGQWPVLAAALAAAEKGDGSQILAMGDEYNGRHEDGTYDTLFQSFGVIKCASGITTQPPDDPAALLQKIHEQAPRFGKSVTLDDLTPKEGEDFDGCLKLTGAADPVKLDYAGDGPIVIIGGTNDPATPIRWAEEMTTELGPNARMVKYTGEGHGQLLVSTCVTDIEAALLSNLDLPDTGTVCDPDPKVERPTWFDDMQLPDTLSGVVALPAVNAALGLSDTTGYGEVRTTSLSLDDAADAIDTALSDAGFQSLGRQDIGIDDTIEIGFFAPDGGLLVVIVMGPASFDTEDLSSAKPSVPAGKTVVLFAYVVQ
jgi:pimeloyl-ACP methyl ester carboxylesterase